jgi:hypothetical protein
MKVAKRPVGSWTYIPKEDRELPADKQTRVICRQLSQAERMESWDNLNWTQRDTEGNVTLLPRTFQLARQLCINCIIGIENFDSPTPWPAMGSDEEKGAWLDNIPDMEMLGIGQAIRQRAFLEDEIKN